MCKVDQSPVVVHKDGVRNQSVKIEEKRHKKKHKTEKKKIFCFLLMYEINTQAAISQCFAMQTRHSYSSVAHVHIVCVSERLIGTHTHTDAHTPSLSFYSLIASDRMCCRMFLSFKSMLVARGFQITIYERKI